MCFVLFFFFFPASLWTLGSLSLSLSLLEGGGGGAGVGLCSTYRGSGWVGGGEACLSSSPLPPKPAPSPTTTSLLAVIFSVATSGQSDQADSAHDSSLMATTTEFTKKKKKKKLGVEQHVGLSASMKLYTRIPTH